MFFFYAEPEQKTLEWNILNPDQLITLEINNRRKQALFHLEIKKKRGLSINPDIHHSKVLSSDFFRFFLLGYPTNVFTDFQNKKRAIQEAKEAFLNMV